MGKNRSAKNHFLQFPAFRCRFCEESFIKFSEYMKHLRLHHPTQQSNMPLKRIEKDVIGVHSRRGNKLTT